LNPQNAFILVGRSSAVDVATAVCVQNSGKTFRCGARRAELSGGIWVSVGGGEG